MTIKEDIYGWKCRLVQIEDIIRFLEKQKEDITQQIFEHEATLKEDLKDEWFLFRRNRKIKVD